MMLTLLLTVALAHDIPVPLDKLPEPVKAAVLARWPGATLLSAEREGTVFDVELKTTTGEHWEAEVTAEGVIREVEREDGPGDDEDKVPAKP